MSENTQEAATLPPQLTLEWMTRAMAEFKATESPENMLRFTRYTVCRFGDQSGVMLAYREMHTAPLAPVTATPIYQTMEGEHGEYWQDTDKAGYDAARAEFISTRIVYATPSPTKVDLTDKLVRAERALLNAGFQDLGGAEWKPPIGESPRFIGVPAKFDLSGLKTYDPDRECPGVMELRDTFNDGDFYKVEDVQALIGTSTSSEDKAETRDAKGGE